MVRSLLSTGLLAACLAGCSKSKESSHAGKPQIGRTNAVAVVSLLSAEATAETSIADLKAKRAMPKRNTNSVWTTKAASLEPRIGAKP